MAQKRMFSKTIIDSDVFLDMPHSTQLLYFHLNMRADDDGFINNCKNIMRMIACKDDDLKILITKKFVIPFESGVIVIKHWRIHNYIQNDRYTETKYKEEKSLLFLDENKSYTLKEGQRIQNGYTMDTQNKSKNKILDINNIYGQNEDQNEGQKEEWEKQFDQFYEKYPKKVKKQDVKKWFKKNKPSNELFSSMINSLEQFRASNDWQKDGGQFIPYPSTWLNQKRWEDETIQKVAKETTGKVNCTQREYSEDELNSLYANYREKKKMIDKTEWKIRNRLEQLQNREKIVINTKILKTNQDSNIVKSETKKMYKYYRCDYCNDEIRLDLKKDEKTGGIVTFPHSLTKRGKLTLVLCNKCLNKAFKEFET